MTLISVASGGPADIQYSLDNGTTGSALGVTSLAAPSGRRFATATVTSSSLAGPNVKSTDTGGTPFTVRFFATLSMGATAGTRTNTATATLTYPDNPELGTITATGSPVTRTVTLVDPTPATPYTIGASNLGATVTGGGVPLVGGEVVWTGNGAVSNFDGDTTLTPQYVYLAPLGWDIKANGASFVSNDPGADVRLPDGDLRGQQLQGSHRRLADAHHQHGDLHPPSAAGEDDADRCGRPRHRQPDGLLLRGRRRQRDRRGLWQRQGHRHHGHRPRRRDERRLLARVGGDKSRGVGRDRADQGDLPPERCCGRWV